MGKLFNNTTTEQRIKILTEYLGLNASKTITTESEVSEIIDEIHLLLTDILWNSCTSEQKVAMAFLVGQLGRKYNISLPDTPSDPEGSINQWREEVNQVLESARQSILAIIASANNDFGNDEFIMLPN